MELIAAVDLLDGIAVRLVQGDYGRRAASVTDPSRAVIEWVRAGVRWLHLVDLAGARTGRPVHLDLAARLAAAARAVDPATRVELGGGLRRAHDVEAVVAAGIDVAVLGTAAVEDPAMLDSCLARWPGRIAASIDVRDDTTQLDGWTRSGATDAVAIATRLVEAGVAHLIVTDVRRDGTRRGANLELLGRMREALPEARLIAAGGIGTAVDLHSLRGLGLDGAIVGLALLDGSLPVADALAAAGAPSLPLV